MDVTRKFVEEVKEMLPPRLSTPQKQRDACTLITQHMQNSKSKIDRVLQDVNFGAMNVEDLKTALTNWKLFLHEVDNLRKKTTRRLKGAKILHLQVVLEFKKFLIMIEELITDGFNHLAEKRRKASKPDPDIDDDFFELFEELGL